MDEKTIELIGILVAVVLGFLGSKPMNWFKNKLGVEDGVALILVYALSGAVALIALAAAGAFADVVLSVEGIVAFAAIYFAAAQAAYQRLK